MATLTLLDVSVRHDDRPILSGVSFAVPDGSVAAVIGASGAGKSTVLRAVAGLDAVSEGRILLDDEDITAVPVERRDVSMVFQSAWLQPHLDVERNVGFPLAVRRRPAEEVRSRVSAEARAFSLRRLLRRRPRQLSAGEQAAAATAHALVRRPRLILMDEPLARVDTHQRAAGLQQIATVQSGYGTTMLIATNDPSVAAVLAGRIVVLEAGRVRQVGAFQEIYDRPADLVVAGMVGDPSMNVVRGRVLRDGRGIQIGDTRVARTDHPLDVRGEVAVGIRPEHVEFAPPDDDRALRGVVARTEFVGATTHVHVTTDGGDRVVARTTPPGPGAGERLGVRARRVHVFGADGRAVAHLEA